MASLHQFIPSIFLFIFIIKGNSLPKYPPPSFSCGDGVNFAYPFWQRSQKPNHFGYTSLGVTCINKTPTIQLDNNHLYRVKSVNNSENSFVVSFYELGDTTCPVAPHDVVINRSSFLTYSNNVKLVNFFYNCTVYPSGVEPIKCLQVGARHSYVFLDGSVPKFDWKTNCDSLVTIPMSIESSITTDFGKGMKQGFELKWSTSVECASCEASSGLCVYDNEQMFSCSCGKGGRYANCHERGLVSSKFKWGLLSIGLLICCVIIGVTILYIVKKRKDGSYKRGFNRLPTGGK
ncbi:putative wall-associated receptor kinase [Helianthus annuus]|uniref:non-specific serine/threonine protein kinase n=2 Tax=Helianthus annuus TaxID=4232 RepID=A0A251URC0_HELAN|nr:putative wall-associated receptor kinase [Helianthus annuus]